MSDNLDLNLSESTPCAMRMEELTGQLEDGEDSDNDRAMSVLSEAVSLFEDLQRGCSLSLRHTHLEEVSKVSGVSPAIILYGYRHGPLRAHRLFLKKEFVGEGSSGKTGTVLADEKP